MEPVALGIIGCGNISPNYLKNLQTWPFLKVKALADIIPERSQAKAKEFNIARACTNEELLADPEIQVVINLTPPRAHYEVAAQIVAAGKHAYSEKPMAHSRDLGKQLRAAAKEKKVRLGGAPDTFFGAGQQTARKLLDDGAIGRPVAATAFMLSHGPESWHPDPEFFYQVGGGPMFDMGPYYLTALVNLLGPMKRVCGFAGVTIPDRTITAQTIKSGPDGQTQVPNPKFGQKIAVETPDHIAGTIEFENGALATLVTSFAVTKGNHDWQHPITLFGTEGVLAVPDPNGFDIEVKLARGQPHSGEWETVPYTHTTGYGRGVGVADLAYALRRRGRKARASGELTFAVLEAMQGFLDSSISGKAVKIKARHQRPAALPTGLVLGELDS